MEQASPTFVSVSAQGIGGDPGAPADYFTPHTPDKGGVSVARGAMVG